MKKKLLLLALVITALVSVFTVSAFAAEETPTLEIKGANLSFDDSVYIRYAVSHEGIEASEIKMLFWTAPQDSMDDYVIGTEDYSFRPLADEETVGGASCVIFENDTLHAKNMTDYVYARAYAEVDGTVYYSEVNKYSILQYAYNKLGKTGTATESETLRKMLDAMLTYGAAAQLHFDHAADRPADADFYQVKVEGGALSDGFAKGLYLEGETVTLTAPEAIEDTVFVGWQNAAGETVAETAVATVTVTAQNEVYTAIYKEVITYSEGLEFVSHGDGTCYVVGIGTCTDEDVNVPPVSPAGDTVVGVEQFKNHTHYSLKSITLPDSVTTIGYRAFKDCYALTKVVMGNSVTTIGNEAFRNCSMLSEIAFSDTLKTISDNAFNSCTSLTSIEIPDSVRFIYSDVFTRCTALTTVSIGKSVSSIGVRAFSLCTSLTSISVSEENNYFASVDGDLYSKNGKNLVQYAIGKEDESFVVPSGVLYILDSAFSSATALTSVTLPDGLLYISDRSFNNCQNLVDIRLPNSITNIGYLAFYACPALESVFYAGTSTDWAKISIGTSNNSLNDATLYYYSETAPTEEGNFWHYVNGEIVIWPAYVAPAYSEGLVFVSNGNGTCYVKGIGTCTDTDLRIPPTSPAGDRVLAIGERAFYDCSRLTSVTIPDSVTSIGSEAFYDCSSLTSVTIGNSVTSIGDRSFACCARLTWIEAGRDGTYYSIDGNLYTGTTLVQYACGKTDTYFTIPNSVTSIGYGAFGYCDSLTSVTIPDSVTSIGAYAFYNCTSLTSVTIPDSVTSIGDGAFCDCDSLTSVVIGDSVTSIGDDAFYDCDSLTSVTIPDSVTSIGAYAFYHCTSLTSVTIPDSVTSIGDGAFCDCDSLTSVTIPNSVTSIGDYAFYNCTSLTNVYYMGTAEEWANISIGTYNEYLTSATRYYYSETAPTEEGNFWHYVDGEIVIWPEYVAPAYSEGLTFVSYGNGECGVSGIGTCTDTDLRIPPVSPEGHTVIDVTPRAFQNCTTITSIVFPQTLIGIGTSAFSGCSALKNVTIPDGVTLINSRVFENCTALEQISIPSGVTKIEFNAFENCTSLTSVVIPDSVITIGDSAFTGCSALESVTISNSVTYISQATFSGCVALKSVMIPDSVITVAGSAFSGCSALTDVTIGNGVTTIQALAFYNCTSLQNVYMSNLANWCQMTFGLGNNWSNYSPSANPMCYAKNLYWNGELLTELVVPEGVTFISDRAFYNCDSLTSVTVPNGVASIGASAFYNCSNLVNIILPDTVLTVGNSAFNWCLKIATVYYKGTVADWSAISIGASNDALNNATRYYYSESEPTEEGNFWHYVNGEIVVW